MEHILQAGVVQQCHCDAEPSVSKSECSKGINQESIYGKSIPGNEKRKAWGSRVWSVQRTARGLMRLRVRGGRQAGEVSRDQVT